MKITKNKKRIDPRYFLNEQGREEEELISESILDQLEHGGEADPSTLEKAWNSYMEFLDSVHGGGGQRGAYTATRRRDDDWGKLAGPPFDVPLSKIGRGGRELGDDEPEFVVHPAKDPPRDPRGDAGFMNFLRDVAMGRDWRKGLPRSEEPIDAPLLEPEADPRYPL
jgi:hypothetical protein